MAVTQFTVSVEDQVLDDLRARIRAAHWPHDPDNADWSYGTNVAYLKGLASYWADGFDWRRTEREINAFAHFRTVIDDVPVHFMRARGKGPNPTPLILTHGWPWTFWDMSRVIGALSDPASHGGDPADAFDVIVPSLPGFGYSTPLEKPMNFWRTANIWQRLMTEELGFTRYAAAGGDWGALVTEQLGHKYASSLHGIHLIQTIPLNMFSGDRYFDLISSRGMLNDQQSPEVRQALIDFAKPRFSHVAVQTLDPETLAIALHDSPVGLLSWLVKRRWAWGDTHGDVESAFPRDHLCATATLYWATKSFVTSARFYANAGRYPWKPSHDRVPMIEAPAGISFMGGENPPGTTAATRVELFRNSPPGRDYNLHFLRAHERGGHFGHYENPEACITDIRETFRDLRRR